MLLCAAADGFTAALFCLTAHIAGVVRPAAAAGDGPLASRSASGAPLSIVSRGSSLGWPAPGCFFFFSIVYDNISASLRSVCLDGCSVLRCSLRQPNRQGSHPTALPPPRLLDPCAGLPLQGCARNIITNCLAVEFSQTFAARDNT